jgi:hypothetical protein
MSGRIPNAIKKYAKEQVEKYGKYLAFHYACYNTNWSNPSPYDLWLISAIEMVEL